MDAKIAARLAAKACEGDIVSFERLYNMTIRQSYFFVKKAVKDDSAAEEILKNSYIKAYRNLKKLDKTEKYEVWFNGILASGVKQWLSTNIDAVFDGANLDCGTDVDLPLPTVREGVTERRHAHSINSNETRQLTAFVLDGLTYSSRAYLLMYCFLRLDEQTIADSLHVSSKAVKYNLRFAAQKINESLGALEVKYEKVLGDEPLQSFFLLVAKCADCFQLPAETDRLLLAAIRAEAGEKEIAPESENAEEKEAEPKASISPEHKKLAIIFAALLVIIGVLVTVAIVKSRDGSEVSENSTCDATQEETGTTTLTEYENTKIPEMPTHPVEPSAPSYAFTQPVLPTTYYTHYSTATSAQTAATAATTSKKNRDDVNDPRIDKGTSVQGGTAAARDTTTVTTTKRAATTTTATTMQTTTAVATATTATPSDGGIVVVTTTKPTPTATTTTKKQIVGGEISTDSTTKH